MARTKRHPFKLLGLVVVLGLVALVLQILIKAGVFKSVENYGAGVQTIASPPGIEDLDYDPESGTVFLSSHDRRNWNAKGAIYAMHPETHALRNLTAGLNLSEFRPHGISFLDFNDNKYLFVISHRNLKNVVMKFLFKNDSLHLEKTYSSTDFSSPNDLLAVGEDAFFLSNDHGAVTGWKKTAADYLRLPVGNVVYYDGQRSGVVVDKLPYPNGIAHHNDRIYIASTLGNDVGVYRILSSHYQLEKEKTIPVPAAPDNLMVYGERIYVAAHPKLLAFSAHALDSTKSSPSCVYYIENNAVYPVYMGTDISGSSTALPVPDSSGNIRLFTGSVFERRILEISPLEQ